MLSDGGSEASNGSLTGLAWFLFLILLLVAGVNVALIVLLIRSVGV